MFLRGSWSGSRLDTQSNRDYFLLECPHLEQFSWGIRRCRSRLCSPFQVGTRFEIACSCRENTHRALVHSIRQGIR